MKANLKVVELKEFEKEIIRQAGNLVSIRRGSNLFAAGETANRVFLVEKGWLKICRVNPEGEHIAVGNLRGPGDLLGAAEALWGEHHKYGAHGVTDGLISVLSRKAFLELLDTEPFLAVKLSKTVVFLS